METKETIVKQVQAALEHVAHLSRQGRPLNVFFDGSMLTLEGEVRSVAAKKMALEAAGMISGIRGVIDRLRVGPAELNGNGALRTAVCQLLLEDVDFRNCTIRALVKGRLESLREQGEESSGCIVVAAEDGVVTLAGDVISLTHKRLAGVMAWWAQGCRDVVTDALRLVLETDRRVHAEQIGIRTENHVITLEGVVASEDERRIAEQDAWYLYAVDKVVNRLEVRP
jgi:osmotically-inducible protein OsmY